MQSYEARRSEMTALTAGSSPFPLACVCKIMMRAKAVGERDTETMQSMINESENALPHSRRDKVARRLLPLRAAPRAPHDFRTCQINSLFALDRRAPYRRV